MKVVFLLILAAVTHAGKHSQQVFYTGSSGVSDLPEFVAVSFIDDVAAGACDSITRRAQPKYDWVNRVTEDDPRFWEWNTENCMRRTNEFKVLIDTFKQRFNQTGGVHTYQVMYGCEWDDETEEVHSFYQDGYDGEDVLSFDLNTQSWVALTSHAVITKQERDRDSSKNKYIKDFLTMECPKWLKKFVSYGKHVLLRKELPSVSLLQKTPSSPVTCHATGFYPDRADLFWKKDGEELHEDVDRGEILPNHDGTFQMSVDLHISSIAPEDWKKYDCVFQLSGVKDDIITKLDKAAIRTNPKCPKWLKKFVSYGKHVLLRKELPSVSLLQKTPSSLVTCHATGFYPDRADLFWMKDGEELHENVDKGEILPNHDGTFQMSVDLKISSIAPEDWKKYDCVFQLSGVKDDINTKLDKAVIRTNEGKTGITGNEGNPLAMIIPIVAVVVLVVIAVVGFIVYKKKNDKRPPSPAENREVQEQMLPQP